MLKLLVLLGFLLYPIYAIPWILKSIEKNEFFGFVLYSLLMAYLAYLMIPLVDDDLTRYYESYIMISSMDIGQIMKIYPMRFGFYVYLWILSHLGFPKEFMPFSITFIMYILYFVSLRKVLQKYKIHEQTNNDILPFNLLLLLGFFMIVNEMRFIIDTSGLRNSFAFAIFIYGLIDYHINKRKQLVVFFSILSLLIHISILPLLVLLIVSYNIKINYIYRILFIISFILMISGMIPIIYSFILEIIKPILESFGLYISGYFDMNSKYGPSFYIGKSLSTIIYGKVIKPLPFYLAGFYILLNKRIANNAIENFLYLSFVFIAIVSITKTLMDRYSYFYVLFFIFIYLEDLMKGNFNIRKRVFLILFMISLLIMDVAGVHKYKNIFIPSWSEALYIPAPFMLLKHIEPSMYIERPE